MKNKQKKSEYTFLVTVLLLVPFLLSVAGIASSRILPKQEIDETVTEETGSLGFEIEETDEPVVIPEETEEPGESEEGQEPIETEDSEEMEEDGESESETEPGEIAGMEEIEETEELPEIEEDGPEMSILGFDSGSDDLPGTGNNPYLIESVDELAWLAVQVNNKVSNENGQPYSELYYKLTDNLDLNEYSSWTPIGIYTHETVAYNTDFTVNGRESNRRPFKGIFDGSGYTISNLRTAASYSATMGYTKGLFGFIDGAEIRNLNVAGADVNGRGSSAILVGHSMGNIIIENCHIAGKVTTSGAGTGTGGLIGFLTMEENGITPVIRNSTTDAVINSSVGTGRTGGLIGYVRSGHASFGMNSRASWQGTLSIENCTVNGSVNGTSYHLGGLLGEIAFMYSEGNTVKLRGCHMNAQVTGASYHSGGLVGYTYSTYADNNTVIIDDCGVDSSLIRTTTAGGYHTGGVIGYAFAEYSDQLDIQILDCSVKMKELLQDAIGAYDLGGLVGNYHVYYSAYNNMTIERCNVSGDRISTASRVTGTTAGVGGLIGTVKYYHNGRSGVGVNEISIKDCDINSREIRGNTDNIGGLIGLYFNDKSDDTRLEINNSNVYSDAVYGYLVSGEGNNRRVGGAMGWYRLEGTLYRPYLEINDCIVESEVYTEASDGYEVGGVVGYLLAYYAPHSEIYLSRCITKGDVHTRGAGSYRVGGVVGIMNTTGSSEARFRMEDCEAYGNVTTSGSGAYKVGGVLGELLYGQTYEGHPNTVGEGCTADIINCHSYGDNVTASGSGAYYVGGLIGVTDVNVLAPRTRVLVENCSSSADVSSGSYYVGGLIGFCENARPGGSATRPQANSRDDNAAADINEAVTMYTTVRNCYATGNVTARIYDAGGLIGHCHAGDDLPNDTMLVENCYATGDVEVTGGYNAGGLIGRPSKNVTVKNSYAVGDVRAAGRQAGGFIGFAEGFYEHDNHVTIENCYATGNVVSGNYGSGGFIGNARHSFIKNCYATGSVHNTSSDLNYTGGFAGWIVYGGRVINCYSTGQASVTSSNKNRLGGFIGRVDGLAGAYPLYVSDCLYDLTTSGLPRGVGLFAGGSGDNNLYLKENGVTVADVRGYRTSSMIHYDTYGSTFSSWNVEDNVCAVPSSKRTAMSASPWYIDNDVTYPYLFYQADGFSDDLLKTSQYKPERLSDAGKGKGYLNNIPVNPQTRSYYIAEVGNASSSGGNYVPLGGRRADYNSSQLVHLNAQYRVTTSGAAKVYFPYIYGKTAADYNQYKYTFDGSSALYIPANSTYAHASDTLYSLGSVSATNITAFAGGPYAAKGSDRPVWVNGREDTYTYVGQTVEYAIAVANYSTEADWEEVIVTDPLVDGVTLIGQEVYADYGSGSQQVLYWNGEGIEPSTRAYYTYSQEDRELKIYIGDFPAAVSNDGVQQVQKCEITFLALVGREAATVFNSAGGWDGDNIRNRGSAYGILNYLDGSGHSVQEIPIDDNNTDPVYDTYLIIYNSNYDMDDERTLEDIEVIKDYCITDGSGRHTVLANEDPEGESDYVGFWLDGHLFAGWFYYGEDGSTKIEVQPGDEIGNISRDTILFAIWEEEQIEGAAFRFFKTDAVGSYLGDAVFELYMWMGEEDPESNEMAGAGAASSTSWVKIDTYRSTGAAAEMPAIPVTLIFTESGWYQLLEVEAPEGYYTAQDQWRFEVDLSLEEQVSDPEHITNGNSLIAVPMEKTAEDIWVLANYQELEIEFLKVSNAYYHSDGTYSDLLEAVAFDLYQWMDEDNDPSAADLVDSQSVAAGKWLKYGSSISGADGLVSFRMLNSGGIYQLVETNVPADYQLPTGQWRMYLEPGGTSEDMIQSITAVNGADDAVPPAFKVMDDEELGGQYEGWLALVNIKKYKLPMMGGAGISLFALRGLLLLAAGIILAFARKGRNSAKKRIRPVR